MSMEERSTERMIHTLRQMGDRWERRAFELIEHALDQGATEIQVFAPTHQKLGGMTASAYIVREKECECFATVLSRGFPVAVGNAAKLTPDPDGEEVTTGSLSLKIHGKQVHFEVAIGPGRDDWVLLRLKSKKEIPDVKDVFQSLYSPPPERFTVLSSPLVQRAREQAQKDFDKHARKVPRGSNIGKDEYFTHLHSVATILSEYGFDAEVIAAGYLHDHLEDLPKKYDKQRLARMFTPRIAELVDWVTQQDKGISWEERNRRYNERLVDGPDEALAISAADKLSNIMDLIPFLKRGYKVESMLKRGWKENSKKFHELMAIYEGRIPDRLYERLEVALEMFDRLGASNK